MLDSVDSVRRETSSDFVEVEYRLLTGDYVESLGVPNIVGKYYLWHHTDRIDIFDIDYQLVEVSDHRE